MVPEGWERVEVGEAGTVVTGSTPPTKNAAYYGGDVPFVSPADLGTRRWIASADKTITDEGLSVSRSIPSGSALFVCIGSTIGKVGQAGRELATNQQINAVVPNENTDADFLYYELCHRSQHIARLAGNQAVPIINKSQFSGELIDLPPLPEQRKIADILSTWDRAIETTEALLATARTQKRALMQSLLTGKRRFPEFEGQEWKEVRLGELGNTFTGLTGKTKDDFGKGLPYIPYLNIFQNSRIDTSQFDYVSVGHNERQNRVQFGDIFLTTSSETPDEVGMASVLLDDIPDLFLNSFCFGFRLHDFETLRPRFAQFFLRGQDFRRALHRLAQGATRYNLSKTHLVDLNLVLPPVEEQERIADVLETAQTEETDVAAQIEKLRTEKKALMQQLLTGKRRVVVEDDHGI